MDRAVELERVLADALTSADPAGCVQRAAENVDLDEETRAALRSIDPDGLRIAALLVAKLRFERLLQGSTVAGDWFEADPRGFTAAFKRYHLALAPRAASPLDEAVRFEAWSLAEARPERPGD